MSEEKERYIVGLILARGGSQRLPNKNILSFAGNPLFGHGIMTLFTSSLLDEIVVCSEDEIILELAKGYAVDLLERPPELAAPEVPWIDVFKFVHQKKLEQYGDTKDLYYVVYNHNMPFISSKSISRCVDNMLHYKDVLSSPHALWGFHGDTIMETYNDDEVIKSKRYRDPGIIDLDIHTDKEYLYALHLLHDGQPILYRY